MASPQVINIYFPPENPKILPIFGGRLIAAPTFVRYKQYAKLKSEVFFPIKKPPLGLSGGFGIIWDIARWPGA